MESIEIKAKLEYIIFENDKNHYMVGSFSEIDTYHTFTAAGRMIDPEEDQSYLLTGNYVTHPRYGNQFQIRAASLILPTHKKGIIRFLSSDAFPAIGKKTAEQIYDQFGEECLEIIKNDPEVLNDLSFLNRKKIETIVDGIAKFNGFNENYLKLVELGLDDNIIHLLEDHYDDVMDVLQADCFKPYYEIYGFGYKTAVKLANSLGIDKKDSSRQDAFIFEQCRKLSMLNGDTYIYKTSLMDSIPRLTPDILDASLKRLSKQESLTISGDRIYPFSLYDEEIDIAHRLFEHVFNVEIPDEEEFESCLKTIEFSYGITYAPKQVEAIRQFFTHSISIINGGPGTGKTTTVKAILEMCRHFFPDAVIQLCAPTGRASKRLAQLSECDSKTIHSLLKWNMDDNVFGVDENDPLPIDFLIVDEFSMVDTHLFSSLLKGLYPDTRILLIGDEDQLESVGPGKVFEDILASELFPVVHLNDIFRQEAGSGIVSLAQSIRKDQQCEYHDGVTFIECDTSDVLNILREKAFDIDLETSQILAPIYNRSAGIDAINTMMQELRNPYSSHKAQIKIGTTIFRVDDKVMLLKNMPEDDVYNGDIGTILDIEILKGNQYVVSVDFGSGIVDFSNDLLYYLKHAYCISVHKSQGSEYDTVFCVVDKNSSFMLEKRLLYTGVSRAKKELYIIGQKKLFETSVKLKQKRIRQTSLKERLLELDQYQ
ncbi:MAG: ATP-dependent RecD-like DNA helicase [Faecalicoccus sp.]|nr:ATP-dependent RecD-like DNA helicase [Faecalicoccus sp.]